MPVQLFIQDRGRPKPSAIWLEEERPESVKCALLPGAKLSGSSTLVEHTQGPNGNRIKRSIAVNQAVVNEEDHWKVWAPAEEDCDKDFLQVDLGRECIVTDVSTKGRAPQTTMFPGCRPQRHYSEADAEYAQRVDTWESHREWLWHTHGLSEVPVWHTRSMWEKVEFVKRYELSIRCEGGMWIKVPEVFQANTEFHTERANSLHMYAARGEAGVRARYLRFTPLSLNQGGYHGRKAMRVGVYGHELGQAAVECKRKPPMRGEEIMLRMKHPFALPAQRMARSTRRKQSGAGHNWSHNYRQRSAPNLYGSRKRAAFSQYIEHEEGCFDESLEAWDEAWDSDHEWSWEDGAGLGLEQNVSYSSLPTKNPGIRT